MARVKVCRLCGVHNGPDELFCTGCGTSLADVAAVDESEIARAAAAEEAEESAADVPDSAGGDGVPPPHPPQLPPARRARRHANRPSGNALCGSPGAGCPSRANWASAARRDSRS